MYAYVLLDLAKKEQADRIRQAERDRLVVAARRANGQPSTLRSLLLTLLNR
jgi:hypothetical protein